MAQNPSSERPGFLGRLRNLFSAEATDPATITAPEAPAVPGDPGDTIAEDGLSSDDSNEGTLTIEPDPDPPYAFRTDPATTTSGSALDDPVADLDLRAGPAPDLPGPGPVIELGPGIASLDVFSPEATEVPIAPPEPDLGTEVPIVPPDPDPGPDPLDA